MRIRWFFLSLIVFVLFGFSRASFHSSATAPEYDVVITNGHIVDGTGNPWFAGSVAIKDGHIVDIGQIAATRGARAIDARGKIVAPGFIDVHAHIESGIEKRLTADNYLQMGVTSVITGNCGGSALRLGEWFAQLERNGVSLNIAALYGHNTVRREGMNGDFDRPPTPEELQRMRELVEQAMRDGAVGFSTGLIYIPGIYAKTDEIVGLAKVAASYGGVYATHMRDEGLRVEQAIKEALEIGEQAKCPVEITVKLVEDARARGHQVTVDQYLYTASSTNLRANLPSWVFDGGPEKAKERLRDATTRARARHEMIEGMRQRGFDDYAHIYIANFPANQSFNGKNISEITGLARRKSGIEEEADQIIEMVLADSAQIIVHSMSEADVEYIFQQPFTMVAADAGVIDVNDASVPHPRGLGNNVRALGTYVRERKLVSLEEGIRKMTSLPAQTFKLWERGLLRPGMVADIVIFDEKTIADRATFQQPKQYPVGIDYVLVNGQVVIEKGKHTGLRPGQILRGRGQSQL